MLIEFLFQRKPWNSRSRFHKQKWGPYRMDHDYYMLYAGTGMPIVFSYCDTGYGDNMGSMPVELYAVP